ncbi:MAG TPA: transaldolase [Acidimicrobiales bacterium]|nr:transaldolase [Acidimicrobiales bacterium]
MTRLKTLCEQYGQSPWLDNLMRTFLTSGGLADWIERGVRGVTSNPTIFQKAIEGGDAYDQQFGALVRSSTVEDAYWKLVSSDIENALDLFAPLHERSGQGDGFVSLEVSPALATDTEGTIRSARALHQQIDRPNLLVKIPATAAGVPAIRQMIAEGRSINITLIFSLDRYAEVIEAYLGGLEDYVAGGGDPSGVHSVASFFVSRVDTEVDRRLERLASSDGRAASGAEALKGRIAVAQAKLAYQLFRQRFSGPRWEALAAKGARLQRPLWASTSTKNPAYPDLLYVDNLIGADTVNTMPDATLEAFLDHGTPAATVEDGVERAEADMAKLAEVGVDLADVSRALEEEGVASFVKSFDELLARLTDKAASLAS